MRDHRCYRDAAEKRATKRKACMLQLRYHATSLRHIPCSRNFTADTTSTLGLAPKMTAVGMPSFTITSSHDSHETVSEHGWPTGPMQFSDMDLEPPDSTGGDRFCACRPPTPLHPASSFVQRARTAWFE